MTHALLALQEGQSARNAVLDAVVFVIGVGLLGWLLVWWGRCIFGEE
ncbi:MAG: hypothetical protein IAI48_08000 [Candidatus Eremiobacteraeota bacterium]|nr:hypothetical protein [Candidatus Eremiobacteraeota bacterium]